MLTTLMVVRNPTLLVLFVIASKSCGFILNLAFSGLASSFFVFATKPSPDLLHEESAGEMIICIAAASFSPNFAKAEVIEESESTGKSLKVLIGLKLWLLNESSAKATFAS